MASNNSALVLPAPGSGGTNQLEAADIRGIKGPVALPSSFTWLGWLLLALALAALARWLWRRFRKQAGLSAPAAILIPPHRRAKDRLRSASELMSDPYAFCSLVSDVIRAYLEERFDLHAPDRTTEEFLEEMRSRQVLRVEHKRLLEDFLSRCDLVKFARFEPRQDELQSLLDSALRFIDETALEKPEPPAADAVPANSPQPLEPAP